MRSWVARVVIFSALTGAGGTVGWKLAEEFPVQFQGQVRVSVPYETTRGVEAGSLPMQETPARSRLEPSAEWLGTVSERLKANPSAVQPADPFESELDYLRRSLSVRIERQAGQDDYVIEHRSLAVEGARAVLSAAGDACLESFRKLHDRQLEEQSGPLLRELEEWQAKARAFETEASKIQAEIAALATGAAGRETARERAKLLAAATAEARKSRLEAENRFVGARDDMTAGRPVETVLARLPEGPLRTTLTQALDQRDHASERRELERELARLSELYGAKHPRITKAKQRIAELSTQADQTSASRSPADMLLATLEADWREKLALEQDLSEQLAADEESLGGFDAIQARLAKAEQGLGEARAKLATLAARRDAETARSADGAPRISEAPTVPETPVTWTEREWTLAGGVAGAALGLLAVLALRRSPQPVITVETVSSIPIARPEGASTLLAARRLERLGRLRQLQSGPAWSQPAPSRM